MKNDQGHDRGVWDKLIKVARVLKKKAKYRGSWNTLDIAVQAHANLAKRKPAVLLEEENAGYLWRAVENAIKDKQRADRRRPDRDPKRRVPDEETPAPEEEFDIEEQIARREVLAHLERLLHDFEQGQGLRLSPERRRFLASILRRKIAGETHREIAADLGVDPSTVAHWIELVVSCLRNGNGNGNGNGR